MARRRRRTPRTNSGLQQLPWQAVCNPYSPIEVLSADQVQTIIDAAFTVLETKGMRFLEPGSRRFMRESGADVDEEEALVRFPRELVQEQLSHVPSSFTLRARNPERNLRLGENCIVFSAVGGPAFCSDLDNGRRPGTYNDLCNYFKLIQSLNIVHQEGGMSFEPMDLPAGNPTLGYLPRAIPVPRQKLPVVCTRR